MQGEKLDDEMREMVKMEIEELTQREQELAEKIRILSPPKDPNDDKNVIIEIREPLAATRRRCLLPTCTGCIPVMRILKAGRLSSWT